MNQRLNSVADFLVTNDVDKPTGFTVTKEEKPKAKPVGTTPKSSVNKKEVKLEERVHVFMAWPETMKREFDILFLQNKNLRKRGKNEILLDWCREGMKSFQSQ